MARPVLAFLLGGALTAAVAWLLATNPTGDRRAPAAKAERTVTATRGPLEVTVAALGTFQPLRYVDVGAQTSGQLRMIAVGPGDPVRRGQLVAEIDDSTARARLEQARASLASMQAQIAAKRAQLELARAQRDRNARLVGQGFIAVSSLDVAEAGVRSLEAEVESLRAQAGQLAAVLDQAAAELTFAKVHAPMDGVVVALMARAGQTLNAAQQAPVILRIADPGSLALVAQVSEADVIELRPGLAARFSLLGLADREFAGRVRQILPSPNLVNGVVFYDALIEIPPQADLFRIGMTAQVRFVLARHECMLKVPRVALPAEVRPGGRTVLNAVLGDRPQPLEVPVSAANDAEIGIACGEAERAGLAPGTRIIAAPAAAKGRP
ncbi:MAG: efflux RND transporter periplasmic adaptor subunit [Burkholderiales bacterium]|nr:efflux RND transporter periplasmic adaptor subunit [Burkholderiales bacterium]